MDSHLNKLKQVMASAIEGMSQEQLKWHPPDKWCAAEILEHLYLSYAGTIKGFERVMATGTPLAGKASMKQRLQTIAVLGLGYLPSGRKAPVPTQPRGLPGEMLRSELQPKIEAMDALIAQCEARFGRGVRLLDHPILGPLTAAQWRKFHLVHGLHHKKQLVHLRESVRQTK